MVLPESEITALKEISKKYSTTIWKGYNYRKQPNDITNFIGA